MSSSVQRDKTQLGMKTRPGRFAALLKEIRASKTCYLFLAPYAILFTLFTVVPVIMAILLSFTYFNMLQPPQWVGLHNYVRLFLEDEIFLIAVKNTLVYAAITGPVSYLLCFVIAWLINDLKPKVRAFLTLLFYAPSISGNAYVVWRVIFSGDTYGIVNGFLMYWGFIDSPIQWLIDPKYIMPIVILVVLWMSLGTSFLVFIAGLQGIDPALYEAGAIDGVRNRWQELWYLTLPQMRGYLMFGAIMSITSSFTVAGEITTLVGFPSTDYAAHTIVQHLQDYGTIRFDMGYASSIAVILFFMMVVAQRVVQKLLDKVGE
ncbi:MAG: carbohydrate ABC transporter permease [Candidatus Wallacebacter cryptica]|nr:sugar ABC transporter permease [Bacillota bacterium]